MQPTTLLFDSEDYGDLMTLWPSSSQADARAAASFQSGPGHKVYADVPFYIADETYADPAWQVTEDSVYGQNWTEGRWETIFAGLRRQHMTIEWSAAPPVAGEGGAAAGLLLNIALNIGKFPHPKNVTMIRLANLRGEQAFLDARAAGMSVSASLQKVLDWPSPVTDAETIQELVQIHAQNEAAAAAMLDGSGADEAIANEVARTGEGAEDVRARWRHGAGIGSSGTSMASMFGSALLFGLQEASVKPSAVMQVSPFLKAAYAAQMGGGAAAPKDKAIVLGGAKARGLILPGVGEVSYLLIGGIAVGTAAGAAIAPPGKRIAGAVIGAAAGVGVALVSQFIASAVSGAAPPATAPKSLSHTSRFGPKLGR